MLKTFAVLSLCVLFAVPAFANPTGSALMTHPVEPCRILDTRVGLGPLASLTVLRVYVRGSLLQASHGALKPDCGVPAEAEAAVINLAVVNPEAIGHLRVNGTGFLHLAGPNGRLNFRAGENDSNEILVSLCNVFLAPLPHEACPFDGFGRYADFQIANYSAGSVHLVADVVAYLSAATP